MYFIVILAVLLFVFIGGYVILMEIENVKLRRNPIPKKDNSDKRFCEIKNFYSHKIFGITRGN